MTGALALTGLAAPAAQADEKVGNIKVSNIVVNGGKSVVVGATGKKTVALKFTVTDNSGVWRAAAQLFHGKTIEDADSAAPSGSTWIKCSKVSSTKSTCSANYTFKAGGNAINKVAGTWKTWLIAQAKDNNYIQKDNAKSFKVLRAAQLAGANAAPEPVAKGATVTVTSRLTRASWDAGKNASFGSQSVQLQFKAKGASSYKTVKTVKTAATGDLKTTVKATVDGTYRYVFAGTSTTAAATAVGDSIDVK
ncbi:calcium-binding protein [Streptomyces adelaidensis]|uniref:calcium-binding protein n=1 Tax=Streptomyces adelaidensis TaxID=2796465 RepID=UPI0027DD2E80|nr:calcium-binding protein [Streptomyces adelaidensis]